MDFELPCKSEVVKTCVDFLDEIGIPVRFETIAEECFLPGLLIHEGEIVIDLEALRFPGDILHEAGHIAVVPALERKSLNADVPLAQRKSREAEEMMAIAWSYAACIHLRIDPEIVFHEYGYKGGGRSIIENFSQGRLFGTPMLQWCGMTLEPKNAVPPDTGFPKMIKWLRD